MTNAITEQSSDRLYEILKAASKTRNLPQMHSKFTGNAENLVKKLQRAGIYQKQKNHDKRGHYEKINIDLLVPLESQRNVTDNWIYKVLKLGDGFDWIASGLTFVARDPDTNINYVWDGCGRLALAEITGIEELDCWVVELTQAEAAHYFVHVQKTAKRSLDPNIIFCNAYAQGEVTALDWADILEQLGVRVQGADDYWVPQVDISVRDQYPRVKLRSVEQALKYAHLRLPTNRDEISNVDLVRFARDTIVQAGWTDDQIRQDLLPGLVIFYSVYPEAMSNGLNKAFREWFQNLAGTVKQSKLDFKQRGGNLHNREAESVALGITQAFRGNPKFAHPAVITEKRMKAYLDLLANKFDDDEDNFNEE